MKKKTHIAALIMLAIALCFIGFALGHPEASFPWSLTVTRGIYGIYLTVMVILFIT